MFSSLDLEEERLGKFEAEGMLKYLSDRYGSGPFNLVLSRLPVEVAVERVEEWLKVSLDAIRKKSKGAGNLLYFWHPTEYQKRFLREIPEKEQRELAFAAIMHCTESRRITIPDDEFDVKFRKNEMDELICVAQISPEDSSPPFMLN
jgi:hypothetical protein